MLTLHRTYRATIRNHGQVAELLDQHGWSASKLWNVANYHSQQVWEEVCRDPIVSPSDVQRRTRRAPPPCPRD